jgi:hypothetical protein
MATWFSRQPRRINVVQMRGIWAMGLAAALMAGGCETVTVRNGQVVQNKGNGPSGLEGAGIGIGPVTVPRENDAALNSADPCVKNLEDLTGALLFYYGMRRELPPSLDELPPLPDGTKVSVVCPKSGKKYVFYPQGLPEPAEWLPVNAPNSGNRLILYDADAVHEITRHLTNGSKDWDEKQVVRYGILMDPAQPGRPVKMYVVPIEQRLLDGYLKAGQRGRNQGP